MRDYTKFYIGGAWVEPKGSARLDVINPATEAVAGQIAMGTQADVDAAVAAARHAFPSFSATSRENRVELLQNILAEYQKRYADLAAAVTEEMGAPGLAGDAGAGGDRRRPYLDRDRGAQELPL